MSPNADAQFAGAIERAIAKRVAAQAGNREVSLAVARNGSAAVAKRTAKGDYLVKRWNNNLCKASSPCPLPNEFGAGFKGGTYDEIIVAKDTVLYRSFDGSSSKFGGQNISWWKLEPSKGTAAVIDNSIPATTNGNFAAKLARIKVPAGERIYEGLSGPIYAGQSNRMVAVGGKTQFAIVGDASAWEIK